MNNNFKHLIIVIIIQGLISLKSFPPIFTNSEIYDNELRQNRFTTIDDIGVEIIAMHYGIVMGGGGGGGN